MSAPARRVSPDSVGRHEEVTSVGQLLDRMNTVADGHDPVSLGQVVEAVGSRSFAPLLLLPGLVMLAPGPGDIPGVPVLMGLLVILVAGQVLMRRRHLWLPRWLLDRSVGAGTVKKVVRWMRKPARFLDRWTRARQTWLLRHAGSYVIAVACIAVAAATPLMEVVPFTANLAGAVITAFGLALIASDGVLAGVAIALSVATFVVMGQQFL